MRTPHAFGFALLNLSEVFEEQKPKSFLSKWYDGVSGFWPIAGMTALLLALGAVCFAVVGVVAYVVCIVQAWAWNTITPLLADKPPVIGWQHVLAWWVTVNVVLVMPVRALTNAIRGK